MYLNIGLFLYITTIWKIASTTNYCEIGNVVHDCVYTITCEHFAGSAQNPSCDYEPYVTFVIKKSFVETLTAGFFGATNFDSRVRRIEAKENRWITLEESSLKYFIKTQSIDFSFNRIQNVKNLAFKNLVALQNLNLSNNAIEVLLTSSLMTSENRVSELKTIDISFNKLTEISPEAFKYLANLEELYLNNNNINVLGDNVFGDLKNLTRLSLGHNNLNSLNMTLINLKSLKYLDLSHNNILKVSGYELNRLISLQNLNMSYNSIKSVESNCFSQAFNLITVDFSNNKIQSELESTMFINCGKLTFLYFENNNITKIQDNFFKHTSLEYVNLQGNHIDSVLSQTILSGLENITNLNLYNQSFKDIKEHAFSDMKKLLNLNFSMNEINSIDSTSFSSSTALNMLDLSFNNISNIDFLKNSLPNISELFLNNNKLVIIEQGLFSNHVFLKRLDVSKNNIVTIEPLSLPLSSLQYFNIIGNRLTGPIKKDVFSPAKFLRYLNLSNLNITKIEKQAFVDMPVLTRLNLSHNEVDYIDPDNFKSTINMYSLDFSYNKISKFEINNSSSLGGIKSVHLNNNRLKDIPSANLSEILYLDLSNNEIANISKPIFKTFHSLRVLHLSHNILKSFNNLYTNTLKELSDVTLSSNYITSMNLSYFKDLVSLDISNNSLNSINSTFLHSMDYLQSLDISNNNISTLLPGTFQNLKILKLLNMSSNRLTNLRYGSLKGLHRTEVLDLSKNSISQVDVHIFHECTELRKLIIDYNLLIELDIEKLIIIAPKLNTISLGGNPIKCKEIVRSIKNVNVTTIRQVDVTSIDKIFHEDNVYGIKCGDTDYSLATQKPDTYESQAKDSPASYVLITLLVVLLIIAVVIMLGLFMYKRNLFSSLNNRESQLQMRQSLDLSGSDFRGDLLH